MNDYHIGDSIFQALSTVIDSSLTKQKNVKIIDAKILSLLDATIGLYEIEYLGQKLKAYTNNSSVQYNPEDNVYVISKDGTVDGTLIIIGSTAPYAGLYTNNTPIKYQKICDSILDLSSIELCTYQSEQKIDGSVILGDNFNTIFNHYLKQYKTFCLKLNARTAIEDVYQRVNGDYGIVLNIPVDRINEAGDVIESTSIEYYLNTSKMEGDIYNLITATPQSMYITFDEDLIYNGNEITMYGFVNRFRRDNDITTPDIFLTNIEFYPVEVIDASVLPDKYLMLTASQGNYFVNGRFAPKKIITPKLYISGNEVPLDGLDCYWFVEDQSITASSTLYNNKGGVGWKCLNKYSASETNDGTIDKVLVLNQYSLEVTNNEVLTSKKFKCVVIYNDTLIRQTLIIENLDSNITIELKTEPEGFFVENSTVKLSCITSFGSLDYLENNYINCVWTRYSPAEEYLGNDFYTKEEVNVYNEEDNSYTNSINFKANIINDDFNVLACSVYLVDSDTNSWEYIGTKQTVIALNKNGDFYLSLTGANKLYKYDADGDSPMSADYDGPISSIVREIEPVGYKIYKANGEEFTDEEYGYCRTEWKLPKESMMKFDIIKFQNMAGIKYREDDLYYYISCGGRIDINYSILNSYNPTKTNNSIQLEVKINSDNLITSTADIVFLKDGENGTNGTKYSAILTYENLGYNVLNSAGLRNKLVMLYAYESTNVGTWYVKSNATQLADVGLTELSAYGLTPRGSNKSTLGIELYKDGELVDSTVAYTVKWSMFDQEATEPYITIDENGIIKEGGKWNNVRLPKIATVQAAITVTDNSEQNANQTIYVFYPIEMIWITKQDLQTLTYIPDMVGGFNTVLYASDGTNPKWDSSQNFTIKSDLEKKDIDDIFDYSWGSSINLTLTQGEVDNTCKAVPVPKYDSGNANNYITVTFNSNQTKTKEVIDEEINKVQVEKDKNIEQLAKYFIQTVELDKLSKIFGWSYPENGETLEKSYEDRIRETNNKIVALYQDIAKENEDYDATIALFNDDNYYSSNISSLNDDLVKYFRDIHDATVQYLNASDNETKEEWLTNILVHQNPIDDKYYTYNNLVNILIPQDIQKANEAKKVMDEDGEQDDTLKLLLNNFYSVVIANPSPTDPVVKSTLKQLTDLYPLEEVYANRYLNNMYLLQLHNTAKDGLKDALVTILEKLNVAELQTDYISVIDNKELNVDEFNLYNNNQGSFGKDYDSLINFRNTLDEKNTIIQTHNTIINSYNEDVSSLKKLNTELTEKLIEQRQKRISELITWINNVAEDDLLEYRDKLLGFSKTLENVLDSFKVDLRTVYNIEEGTYSFDSLYGKIINEIYLERQKIYALIKDEKVENLKSIDDKIVISETDKANIKAVLELRGNVDTNGVINTLLSDIDAYNDAINNYNLGVTDIKKKTVNKIQNIYKKIKEFKECQSDLDINIGIDDIKLLLIVYNIDIDDTDLNDLQNSIINLIADKNTCLDILINTDGVKVNEKTFTKIGKALDSLLKSFSFIGKTGWNKIPEDKRIITKPNYLQQIIKVFITNILGQIYQVSYLDNDTCECILAKDGESLQLINDPLMREGGNAAAAIKENNSDITILKSQLAILANKTSLLYVKPIVFRTNTFEFSWLNGWDGNKLYLDEDEEYILSPQIGAGAKNDNNQFIGITMGVKQTKQGLNSDIGLFGFSEKGQSIFLDAKTGKAQFGISGAGQINIDPSQDRALLYSGNFFNRNRDGSINFKSETGKGLLIDLTTPEIRFGSGGFWVDKNGHMHAGGNNSSNVEADHSPGITEGVYSEDELYYDNGLELFTRINDEILYISSNSIIFLRDYENNIFSKTDGTELPVKTSKTKGSESIYFDAKTSDYYYYDGNDLFKMDSLYGIYKGNVNPETEKNGIHYSGDIYFDKLTETYWIYDAGEKIPVYVNTDFYGTHCYYDEPGKFYWFYDKDNNIVKFFYDKELDEYITYDKDNDYFYFIDEINYPSDGHSGWIWEPESNNYYYINIGTKEKIYLKSAGNELGGWRISDDSIYSENEQMYMFSGYNSDNEPAIYAQNNKNKKHDTLTSINEGLYAGPSGISVYNSFRVSKDGVYIGYITNPASDKDTTFKPKYWKVYGNKNNSYIYYNESDNNTPDNINLGNVAKNSQENKIYLGTDGVQFSNQFRVTAKTGKILLGDLSSGGKFWVCHKKGGHGFIYHSQSGGEDTSGAKLDITLNDKMDNYYLGTDGIRFAGIFKTKVNGTSGYMELGALGRRHWYFGDIDTGEDQYFESYMYTYRGYRGGNSFLRLNEQGELINKQGLGTALSSNVLKREVVLQNDIYIGTDGIRVGDAFYADRLACYELGQTSGNIFHCRIMEENCVIGVKDSDGNVTWVPLKDYGGGGGSLPQAENYSF